MQDKAINALTDSVSDLKASRSVKSVEMSVKSSEQSEIPIKDKFFMSDLEKYYKYGIVPYLLFLQIFLVITTTSIIIFNTEDLSLFRYHIRAIDSNFNPDLNASEPSLNSQHTLYLHNMGELNQQIDLVLSRVFNFEENFVHEVKLLEKEKIKMNVHYFHYLVDNKTILEFDIKNSQDNPLVKLGNRNEQRKFLQLVQSLTIPISYHMKVSCGGRTLHLRWRTFFIFDFSNRGFITFRTVNNFEYLREASFWTGRILSNLVTENGLANLIVIILAGVEMFVIIRRIYAGANVLMYLKNVLEKEKHYDNENKSKWEMLKLNEKRKFFNLWYFVMLLGNLFQVISAMNHLLFPILSGTNQFLLGFSSFFAWLSCGYFLEYEDKYYFFYLTMKRSVKTSYKYVIVFILIFAGFAMLVTCNFHYSEKYYLNFHTALFSCFSMLLSDSNYQIWYSTFERSPIKTLIFAFFFFLAFIAFLLKMLVTITEESFDCIKMSRSYSWLEKQLSIEDYLKYEMNYKEGDDVNDANNNDKLQHFMLSNACLNSVFSIANENNQSVLKSGNNLINIFPEEIAYFRSRGLDELEINKILRKKLKKIVKGSFNEENCNSQNNMNESNNFTNSGLNKGLKNIDNLSDINNEDFNNKSSKIQLLLENLEALFKGIYANFRKIDDMVSDENMISISDVDVKEIVNKIVNLTTRFFDRLSKIKQIVNI